VNIPRLLGLLQGLLLGLLQGLLLGLLLGLLQGLLLGVLLLQPLPRPPGPHPPLEVLSNK